jgi:hypothetical protein
VAGVIALAVTVIRVAAVVAVVVRSATTRPFPVAVQAVGGLQPLGGAVVLVIVCNGRGSAKWQSSAFGKATGAAILLLLQRLIDENIGGISTVVEG